MGQNKLQVTITLTSAEYELLTTAAKRVLSNGDHGEYVRAAALLAAKQMMEDFRPTLTPHQRMALYRKAEARGHVWTEQELRVTFVAVNPSMTALITDAALWAYRPSLKAMPVVRWLEK